MREFEYYKPTSLNQACDLLARFRDDGRVLAGGQSLLNMMKLRLVSPVAVIDARKLEALRVHTETEEATTLGAMVSYAEAARLTASRYPIIADALAVIADLQIRNLGTIGGSCCQADPLGDMPNVTTALGSEFEIVSTSGCRSVSAAEFFLGPLETVLEPGEMLRSLKLPAPARAVGSAYEKFAIRRGDYAVASIAAVISMSEAGNCISCTLVAGSMGLGPKRLVGAEQAIVGQIVSDNAIAAAAGFAAAECDPQADPVCGSIDYKKALVETLAIRALSRAVARHRAANSRV